MKTENLIKKDNQRRSEAFSKSRLHIYLLLLFLIIMFTSCKTHFVTQYRIKTAERSYYCNHPKFVNDTVRGAELKRNGEILRVFEIPYSKIESVDFNDKSYNWK